MSDFRRKVEILVEFIRVGEIDTLNEKYQAELKIESRWKTNEMLITYDPNVHWNPRLYIENALQEPKEEVRYAISPNDDKTLTVTETRTLRGSFWERLELQNFPFDVQSLSVTIASRLNLQDLELVSDKARKSKISNKAANTFTEQQKWTLYKMVEMSDEPSIIPMGRLKNIIGPEEDYETPEYPKIKASCICSRKAGYFLFNAFFLIFLITATTFTGFAIRPKLPQNRIPATCTFLLTSVSFKWVINRSLPTVSYLTSLDSYSIMCIFYICLLACWHAIVGSNWTEEEVKEIDKWALVGFAVVFLLLNLFFLIWAFTAYYQIYKLKKIEKKYLSDKKLK